MKRRGMAGKVHRFFRKNNFIYLFVSLTILLFVSTVILELPGHTGSDLFSVVTLLMIVVSVQSVKHKFDWKRIFYILALIFIVLALLSRFQESHVYVVLLLLTLLIFFIVMFIVIAREVLFEGDIDLNKVIGSISLYMLIGLTWAIIYLMLLTYDPKTFSGIEVGSWQEVFASVSYYSFVTLTTLGYGDILPQKHVAEFFAYMEAIVGVFYMAIIVASLVSLQMADIQEKRRGK